MRLPITNAILLASLSPVVTAQFGFFDHMFGSQQAQQQRQQPPTHAGSQWAAHAEAVPCPSYLCPDSLVCVARPLECPCPREEDIKCIVPDAENREAGTVVCVRGATGCAAIERLTGAGQK